MTQPQRIAWDLHAHVLQVVLTGSCSEVVAAPRRRGTLRFHGVEAASLARAAVDRLIGNARDQFDLVE